MNTRTIGIWCAVLAAILALLVICWPRPAAASDLKVDGYLGLQGPVSFTPERANERSNEVVGGLAVSRLPLKLRLDVDARWSLRENPDTESKPLVKAQLSAPLDRAERLWVFTFYERRIRTEDDRWVAGVRYNFSLLR